MRQRTWRSPKIPLKSRFPRKLWWYVINTFRMPTLTFRRVLFALSVGSALNRRAGASDTLGNASPVVVSTWPFLDAVRDAFSVLERPASTYYTTSAIDSVVAGASSCEVAQCDGSVGFGKHPDESGFVALDGMVVDGRDVSVGSVVSVKSTKHAAQLAREVLERTSHSILCGADLFASQMGFQEESLRTPESDADWMKWRRSGCQPNFWKDGRVAPDPSKTCGPYRKTSAAEDEEEHEKESNEKNSISNEAPIQFAAAQLGSETNVRPVTAPNSPRSHDTISILAIDDKRHLAAATSTNAAAYRIPGRVGDAAIPGSGGYADDRVGTCGATGDGDILVRWASYKSQLVSKASFSRNISFPFF